MTAVQDLLNRNPKPKKLLSGTPKIFVVLQTGSLVGRGAPAARCKVMRYGDLGDFDINLSALAVVHKNKTQFPILPTILV